MADLDQIVNRIHSHLSEKYEAREKAFHHSREIIRHSANAIRAVHRHDFPQAQELLEQAQQKLADIHAASLAISTLGFVGDAEKEYVEARSTYAFVRQEPLPEPEELGVSYTAYLKGLGETVGELRRHLLDCLRQGRISECERLLDLMGDIYDSLVIMDFPDSITDGLRRITDMARGVLEKTRGDLTLALRQQSLEKRLGELEERLPRQG
jgi:translin